MFKNKTKIISIFLILILVFSVSFVFADDESDSIAPISSNSEEIENNIMQSNETAKANDDSFKKSDVYLAGENVTVDYTVDGNLFVCANTVTINSEIGGDAFILANKVIINEQGYIYNNLFTCAKSVEINGLAYDVYACTEDLTVSGYVYRDIKASCKTLNINGTIGRNVFVDCSNINFDTSDGSKSMIYGDLNYTSNSEISIPENYISGKINFSKSNISTKITTREIIQNYVVDLGGFLAFVLILWLACLWLAPKFLDKTNDYVGKQTLGVLGKGLLALIAIPIACFILILLRLTSGFSLVVLALYVLALIVSKFLFAITANKFICTKANIDKNSGTFGMLIVTSVIVWALSELPYVGGFISFIITVLGLGILVSTILPKNNKKTKEKSNEKIVEVKKVSDKKDEDNK